MNEEIFRKDCSSIINNYKDTYKKDLTIPEINTLGEIVIKEMSYLEHHSVTKPIVDNLTYKTRDTEQEVLMKLVYRDEDFKNAIIQSNPELSNESVYYFTGLSTFTFTEDKIEDSIYDNVKNMIDNHISTIVTPSAIIEHEEMMEDINEE